MFEYKEASFYTDYFAKLKDFKVVEEFAKSKEDDEKNMYVGYVEVLNKTHPLVLRVEIPFTFPHHQLTFRTKSLSGYPHLIHNGKIKYGDWFCLNTPFAETAEEQLNQEVIRLEEWIQHQMKEELPPIIEDSHVIRALSLANAYEWENFDEMEEFSSKARLTFVGDFFNKMELFKNKGHLHCIKSPDGRFYAIEDKSLANYELPYVIVDCEDTLFESLRESLGDFLKLKDLCKWDDSVCEHLLPDFSFTDSWHKRSHQYCKLTEKSIELKHWEEQEALHQIELLEAELSKEESYLPEYGGIKKIKVLPLQKDILIKELKSIKESVLKEHKYIIRGHSLVELIEKSMEELEEESEAYDAYEYRLQCFAIGIKCDDDEILWLVISTNRASIGCDEVTFDIGLKNITIERIISCHLNYEMAQSVTEGMFFGRGSCSTNLKNKRIAIVGLGAIGSIVATSLARTGVSNIGLWDDDIVEPGNICRSAYSSGDFGDSKVDAIKRKIKSINPYIKTSDIVKHGHWYEDWAGGYKYVNGSFYANVNYNDQETVINEIKGYDLIIDCTGSNEMLHFLSYAVPETDIISLCITNHAKDLLCVSSLNGNPFELRKAYLSRIEQDTKNFYVEGSGCYSPTFLASYYDIASLVNFALKDLNQYVEKHNRMSSTIYSYSQRGIIADRILNFKLEGYDIILNVPQETIYDAEDMQDSNTGDIGYVFGCYSKNGKQILITHIVESASAKCLLDDAYKTSKGLIDYIGDYRYSGEDANSYSEASLGVLASKAEDSSINTNNPLLAVRNPDGSVSFFLYINSGLIKFVQDD